MKKISIALVLVIFSVLAFHASEADFGTNVNGVLLAYWSKCEKITISGIAPIPIVYKVAEITDISIGKDNTLIIKGKDNEDGEKWNLWHVKFYATHIDIKQSVDKKAGTKVLNMFVYVGSYPGSGKGIF